MLEIAAIRKKEWAAGLSRKITAMFLARRLTRENVNSLFREEKEFVAEVVGFLKREESGPPGLWLNVFEEKRMEASEPQPGPSDRQSATAKRYTGKCFL
jgi:hypothetical protein